MNYLLIRTYQKDDYIARLCYESWMLAGFKGEVIFLSDGYETEWLKGLGRTIVRDKVANFGGQLGAKCLIDCINQIEYKDEDAIISCDTDVVMFDNPLHYFNADYGGAGAWHKDGFYHISGQCMIMKGKVAKSICNVTSEQFERNWVDMDNRKINICDDTYFSYHAKGIAQSFKGHWLHEKLYHLEPRTDWQTIIEELKNEK